MSYTIYDGIIPLGGHKDDAFGFIPLSGQMDPYQHGGFDWAGVIAPMFHVEQVEIFDCLEFF